MGGLHEIDRPESIVLQGNPLLIGRDDCKGPIREIEGAFGGERKHRSVDDEVERLHAEALWYTFAGVLTDPSCFVRTDLDTVE